jgi:hypothetical protein
VILAVVTHERQALFLFTDEEPSHVEIYPSVDWARESFESQDVAAYQEQTFTETGQVFRVSESDDLFATFVPTDRVELDLLKKRLRDAEGPQHLADNPAAYAAEWLRLDDLDARRPPFVPVRLWDWYLRRFPNREHNRHWRD